MRQVAHSCVTFVAQNDAGIGAMRHCFGAKRRSNHRDGEKARWRRHLRVAYLCTKWRILCTRRACVVRARGRIGPGRNLASAPRSLSPQRMLSEGPNGPERCVGQRCIDKIPKMRYNPGSRRRPSGPKADDGQLGGAPNQTNPRNGEDSIV
jgi:hypothetical protein